MTDTLENYLKAIFSLGYWDDKAQVKVSEISRKLTISVPAVTDMVRKLQQEGYVINTPYRGVSLTRKGLDLGQKMVRRHRLWEAYLNQELGVPWDEVHHEAERLEHACSDDLINRIDAKLGFPKTDPHGNPIPQQDGSIPNTISDMSLVDCAIGDEVEICRVVDMDQDFLKYMESMGLQLGARLLVKDILSFDKTIICESSGRDVALSPYAATHLMVR